MKYKTFTKIDLWILATLIPLYVFCLNIVLFGKSYLNNGSIFWKATAITGLMGVFSWQVHSLVAMYLRKRYDGVQQTRTRLVFSFLLFVLLTAAIGSMIFFGYGYFHILGFTMSKDTYFSILIVGLVLNITATVFNEGLFSSEKWKRSELEAERLKKESLQSQLQSLKQQINPHFLFNSLNSLSSLIGDNPEEAEKFLDEMSKVYRYLLRYKDTELTDLETELRFINSYFHLLKTRYGSGVEMKLDIHERCMSYLLPPLTLQLLVENAVKHNAVLKERPLLIEVFTNDNKQLAVRNTIMEKMSPVVSNKVGLQNIDERYKLMSLPGIVVEKTEKFFSVTVPLVTPDIVEKTGVPINLA